MGGRARWREAEGQDVPNSEPPGNAEVLRAVEALKSTLKDLDDKFDNLDRRYVPRGETELHFKTINATIDEIRTRQKGEADARRQLWTSIGVLFLSVLLTTILPLVLRDGG